MHRSRLPPATQVLTVAKAAQQVTAEVAVGGAMVQGAKEGVASFHLAASMVAVLLLMEAKVLLGAQMEEVSEAVAAKEAVVTLVEVDTVDVMFRTEPTAAVVEVSAHQA